MISYYCENCKIEVEHSECPVCGSRTKMKSELFWCKQCNIPVYDSVCVTHKDILDCEHRFQVPFWHLNPLGKQIAKSSEIEKRRIKTNQMKNKNLFFCFAVNRFVYRCFAKQGKTVVHNTKTPHRRKFGKCGGDLLGFGCALDDFDIQNIEQRLI